jgi:hypothetical protein
MCSTVPHRANGVNDRSGGKPVAFGEFRLAGRATAEEAALSQEFRAGGAMDCPVNAAAAQQRAIGGVDDGIDGQSCDVGLEKIDSIAHRFPVQLAAHYPFSRDRLYSSWELTYNCS